MRIEFLHRSFSRKLILYIGFTAVIVFTATFAVSYYNSYKTLKREAELRAEIVLSRSLNDIDHLLKKVEVAIDNTEWMIRENLDDPMKMYDITRLVLENNKGVIVGSAIAFEPDYYPRLGNFFSPYSYLADSTIRTIQLGDEDYDYHYMDWYQIPKLLGRSYWSEPYFDEGGGGIMMCTYSRPIYGRDSTFIGIFTADLSLHAMTTRIQQIKAYPNSYNLLVGRGGTYIAHTDSERILKETILTATLDMTDTTVRHIGKAMISGKKETVKLQNDDTLSFVMYGPLERIGWSMAIVTPYHNVFASLEDLQMALLVVIVAGLLLILFITTGVIRKMTRPLEDFSRSAAEIAKGNLHAPLPEITSGDEMGQLRDSFEHMQTSLARYIEELKQTTSQKERIESELRIASDIQMGMVPKTFPPFPNKKGVDIFASLTPAKEVGGDLYDFFIQDEKIYFIIGDVSGKGVPASLFMAITRSLFRMVAMSMTDPGEIVRAMNNTVSDNNEANMFVTLFTGIIDLEKRAMDFCNAGHNPPVLARAGQDPVFMESDTHLPIGIMKDMEYTTQTIPFGKGDAIFLYTDGVTEAENVSKQLYGEGRLLQEIIRTDPESSTALVHHLQQTVKAFAGEAEQSDDITMLAIRTS